MTTHSETFTVADARGVARMREIFVPAVREGSHSEPVYFSAGVSGTRVQMPNEVGRLVAHVLEAMAQGLVVTVSAHSQRLTSQRAADLIGVSRPTLIKMLDAGDIPFTMAGRHRRIALPDVVAYLDRRRAALSDALDAIYEASDGYVAEASLEEQLAEFREVRRADRKMRLHQEW